MSNLFFVNRTATIGLLPFSFALSEQFVTYRRRWKMHKERQKLA